ncbi:MAG TPA: SLC13 family permease [Chloroflexota bacterium]|nr:SLC13 family permease [Chloroflexota bacterium]
MALPTILTFGILILTIGLVILQPGFVNEGVAAIVGTILVLAVGTAQVTDVWQATTSTAPVLVFLIAMMLIAIVAAYTGLFVWAANRAVYLAHHDGRLLFLYLYLFGAVVTIFLSLDVTAIIVAPIVATIVRRYQLSPLPYLLATAYVANNASLFLPMSNLTNMLVYGLLRIGFWDFVRLMTLPNLAAILVNLAIFAFLFRKLLPARFDESQSFGEDKTSPDAAYVAVGLAAVVVGLVIFGLLGWPLVIPAVLGAAVLCPFALARRIVTPRRLRAGVAWSLPPFVIGMYTVVGAASRSGLGVLLRAALDGNNRSLGVLLKTIVATGASSNLVNNLPAALAAIVTLGSLPPTGRESAAFATLIGTNLGPQITVYGSLATMLVFHAGRRVGIRVPFRSYFLVGLVTVPPMLLAAGGVLWLELR